MDNYTKVTLNANVFDIIVELAPSDKYNIVSLTPFLAVV